MKLVTRKQAIADKLPKYFTGGECRRGHIAERYIAGACTTCVLERKAELYQANKADVLAYMKVQGAIYRANNPDKRYANSKKWRSENREHANTLSKATYARNRAIITARARDKFAQNAALEAQRGRVYRQANKGKINRHTAARKAAYIQRTPVWLTQEDHWMIEQAYELAALRTTMFGFAWHVDHVLPLRGKKVSGLHTPYNLQVIPAVENLRKSNRMELA